MIQKSHIFLSAIVFALAVQFLSRTSYAASFDFSKQSLIVGCRIYKIDGTYMREFTGNLCLFMNDGRYITADAERIAMYAPDKTEVWKVPGHYHHQLNWSYDGKSILALSSKFVQIGGKTMRADVLRRFTLDGKVTGEISSQDIFNKLKITREPSGFTWEKGVKSDVSLEISHFNSFHEIPPQDRKSANPNIVAGNYIANSTESGAVLVDKHLRVPLEKVTFPTSRSQTTHDVQLMGDGRILMLNNDRVRNMQNTGPRSSVEYFDPVARKSTYTFEASPPEMFYTPRCGGVQLLADGLIFISHVSSAFYFLDSKTSKIIRSDVFRDEHSAPNNIPIQQAKVQDLTEFLKKW